MHASRSGGRWHRAQITGEPDRLATHAAEAFTVCIDRTLIMRESVKRLRPPLVSQIPSSASSQCSCPFIVSTGHPQTSVVISMPYLL